MKDDLIRRRELLEHLHRKVRSGDDVNIDKEIWGQPAVDAVEVVRCKDCKWRNTDGCPYMNFDAADREDSDFCSDGERRKDDA